MLSVLGIGFLLLSIWRALRVRRDLAAGETQWETALFGSGGRIVYHETPVRFWCAIAAKSLIVILFALVAAAAFRVTRLGRL